MMNFLKTNYRSLLLGILGLMVIGWYLVKLVPALTEQQIKFTAIENPAGFRRIAGGSFSQGFALIGLGGEKDPAFEALVAEVRQDICAALFQQGPLPEGVVPIASFSDYNCPYCRVLTKKLADLERESEGRIVMFWHEFPIFGEASELAAKGALAARLQGKYMAFHERLMRSGFRTTQGYLNSLAKSLDVDPEQMFRDIKSDELERQIQVSRALTKIFGFIGTPSLVIGRTAIQGEISDSMLNRIIEQERKDGPIPACQNGT
jgi:predicted DsbA family dithiol-disulfide isomerase